MNKPLGIFYAIIGIYWVIILSNWHICHKEVKSGSVVITQNINKEGRCEYKINEYIKDGKVKKDITFFDVERFVMMGR